jgi:hypothetical protein
MMCVCINLPFSRREIVNDFVMYFYYEVLLYYYPKAQ